MKKTLVRILAMMLVMMTVFTVAVPALADISQKSDADGDCKKTFYVKTKNTILPKNLKMTMTKGDLEVINTLGLKWKNQPDSYEITIWYWNAKTKKWVEEDNYDIYYKNSKIITLKKSNTYYKILVDSYGVNTTVKSYIKNMKIAPLEGLNGAKFKWSKLPSWTIKNGANCTIYNSNPVK